MRKGTLGSPFRPLRTKVALERPFTRLVEHFDVLVADQQLKISEIDDNSLVIGMESPNQSLIIS